MNITFPNLVAGETIQASVLNAIHADLVSGQHGLTTANLAARAGIVSSQLADRFSRFHIHRMYSMPTVSGSVYTVTDALPDISTDPGAEIDRIYFSVRAGKLAFITKIDIYLMYLTSVGADRPQVWINKNGSAVSLGNGGRILNSAQTLYTLARSATPDDDPLVGMADGDYLEIGLGHNGTTGAQYSGLCIDIHGKMELGA